VKRMPLRFAVSLRTGFFKTERYALVVLSDALAFVKESGDGGEKEQRALIPYSEIKSVTVCSCHPAEIEVRTFSETYVGTFLEAKEAEAAAAVLRFLLGGRFTAV